MGEEIMIAGEIRVTVVAVSRNKVRLGITAPSSVPVARRELLVGSSDGAALPTVARDRKNQGRRMMSEGAP